MCIGGVYDNESEGLTVCAHATRETERRSTRLQKVAVEATKTGTGEAAGSSAGAATGGPGAKAGKGKGKAKKSASSIEHPMVDYVSKDMYVHSHPLRD